MIRYCDLKEINGRYEPKLTEAVTRAAQSGGDIRGKECESFEHSFAEYCGCKHCIGTGNGLDALTIILKAYCEMGAMQPGDEVIVPANPTCNGYSVAKAFTVTAIGMLYDKGLVTPKTLVVDILKKYIPNAIDKNVRELIK